MTSNQQLVTRNASFLQAPNMLLSGHKGEVFVCRFHPDGFILASGSADKQVLIWNVRGDCDNIGVLTIANNSKHSAGSGAVLDLQWDNQSRHHLVSVGADYKGILWDINTNNRVRQFKSGGHHDIINACAASKRNGFRIATASNDRRALVWDPRYKHPLACFSHEYPVTSIAMDYDGLFVFTGSIDGVIRVWDIRNEQKNLKSLVGHQDIITGLSIHPTHSNIILSNAMDNKVSVWDVERTDPHESTYPSSALLKLYEAAVHGIDKNLIRPAWSPNGEAIACGSSDRHSYVWDAATRRIMYKLPGHKGCVNHVDFHPTEPILATCSNDGSIIMGEIELDACGLA